MAAWRNLAILAIALAGAGRCPAQATWSLTESLHPGDCFRIRLALVLAGEWQVQRDDKPVPIKLEATASHDCFERVLVVGKSGLPVKCARWYSSARSAIRAGQFTSDRSLPPARRLVVAQRQLDRASVYCPSGPLTREELETIEHFDTLHVAGLLPGKEVKAGETWKISNPVVQALCAFDGLIEQDLTGKLDWVDGDEARIRVTGSAQGISLGAMARITIAAAGTFHLKHKRLISLEWKQKDAREQGPASPATVVEATWTMSRTSIEVEPKELSDFALVEARVPEGDGPPPDSFLRLLHRDARGRFQLSYDRSWQPVGETEEHLILRLMDRGDWIAQATLTRWTKAEPGKHMDPDEFKEEVADTPGWDPEEIRDDGVLRSEKGHWVYRVSALGELDGQKVLQNFYLVAGPEGDQVVVSVTLRPALAEKLGTRDLSLVNAIDFPAKK
jgi:hypothetical protein